MKQLLLLVFVAMFTGLVAQDDYYDQVLNERFPADGPGGTAIIVKKGEVVYHKAFGKANLELDVDMTTDHIFRIGSITKQFTACAILKLAEEGKLSLDDEITKFLPKYPTKRKTITVEHLLNHTSGIASYTGLKKWDAETRKQNFTPQEMIDYFKNEPMDFDPGDAFRYNNSGYFLLGYIIEKASGMPYADYIESTFFKPLGMSSSSYDRTSVVIPNRAAGYEPGLLGVQNASFVSMTQPYAAGSLLSTTGDLNTWYQAVVSGKVVSRESLAKAHTPATLNTGDKTSYGFGWSLGELEGSPFFGHGGGINGFLTASTYLPEEEVFVAVFSNCNCHDPGAVANKLAVMAIGKYEERKTVELPEAMLASYVGKYELSPQFIITITRSGKQLKAQATGQSPIDLVAFKEHHFHHEQIGIKVRFNPDDDGKISSLTLFQNGERDAKRVE
ncbi:serine hydrolase [Neolewinella agarilytica]|uniref:serine hydrolase n=1 Tax=Neolewinella agarilytica TaxID=478744 RepID=UPI00235343AF|nr:serine hydrolase [Neolewinella agarilytica]